MTASTDRRNFIVGAALSGLGVLDCSRLSQAGGAKILAADQLVKDAASTILKSIVTEVSRRIKDVKPVKEALVIPLYVSIAAKVALEVRMPEGTPPEVRAKAFLVALGQTFENSSLVKQFLPKEFPEIETVDERNVRLELLKDATYGKKARMGAPFDKTQHFFLSGALTAIIGSKQAEQYGFAKEIADLNFGSGFSIADMASNLAGIQFAQNVITGKITLKELAEVGIGKGFNPEKHFPKSSKVNYGAKALSKSEFAAKYGNSDSRALKDELDSIRKEIVR